MQIEQILNLPRKERWAQFFEILKERNIPSEESPADYPEDVWEIFRAINDQEYKKSVTQDQVVHSESLLDLFKNSSPRSE